MHRPCGRREICKTPHERRDNLQRPHTPAQHTQEYADPWTERSGLLGGQKNGPRQEDQRYAETNQRSGKEKHSDRITPMDAEKPTGAEDQKKRLHKHLLKRCNREHREKLPGSRGSGEQSLRESAATQPNDRKRRNQTVDHHEQDEVRRRRVLKSERQCFLPAAARIVNRYR